VRTPFSTYTRAGLYTVELAAPRPSAPALVLLSGYSSGSGLYFRALDHLAAHYHVFCVDVLGTGASERPPFTARTAEEAEAFFVDSLEGWRAASPPLSSTPFTLLGHSLGGFLVGAYALRHPQAVAHLILVNAAGLPAQADARIAAARERHWAVGAVGWAWDMGVTPGALVRAMGPYSQAAVEGMVTRRFSWHAPVPPELHRYIHAILTAQGSGEFALNRLMEFGAHARLPLGPRLLQSWKGRITVLHGERDWLDVRESAALVKGLQGLGVDAEFVSVPGAEHYVFLERPQAFVQSLLQRA
jgi:pimeloyl-ACP methyl ester carboxylesterase